MILLKQWCVQDSGHHIHVNKCDVSEGDFHNHCQNLMITCCSSCYIANFGGEYCVEILVFACTPHDVEHGILHIQLYTVQTPQQIWELSGCLYIPDDQQKKLMTVLMGMSSVQ